MNPCEEVDGSAKPRIAYILTVARTGPLFLGGFVKDLEDCGFDVSFISTPGPELKSMEAEGATTFGVRMKREISPLYDLLSLWRLWKVLRRIRPDITNVGTPKAGFLGGLTAVLVAVPRRLYTLHCLRLETTRGLKRRVLWCAEWLSCRCAHHVYCVSPSLRERAIELKLVTADRISVASNGTCNGIDADRFAPNEDRINRAIELRRTLNIHSRALVIGFVGRLTRDKGIPELYEAFLRLKPQFPDLILFLAGDYEYGDAVRIDVRSRIEADSRVIQVGWVDDPASYYHMMDVLVLPTHREGFPLVSLEAQASGIPVVTTTATGARDSVIKGVTGLCVPVGDAAALSVAIGSLLEDSALRQRMGEAAREWVVRTFDRSALWSVLKEDYIQAIHQKTLGSERRDAAARWGQ